MQSLFPSLLTILSLLGVAAEKHLIIVSLSRDAYYKNYVSNIVQFANDLAGRKCTFKDSFVYYAASLWLRPRRFLMFGQIEP